MKMENDAVPTTGPCASGIKKEKDADPTAGHLHRFSVKIGFSASDKYIYTIVCDQPGTVLRAIKTCNKYDQQFPDENLVIQLGKTDREYAIATHFPFIFIREGVCLILLHKKEQIDTQYYRWRRRHQNKDFIIQIYLKGLIVLGNFPLSDNKDRMKITGCKQPVDNINCNKFKKDNKFSEEVNQTINVIQNTKENNQFCKYGVDLVRPRNRYVGKSVELGNSDVHRVRELIKLGESVCLIVTPFQQGTGFVLFGNFILTNAHLFKQCVEEGNKKLKDDIEVEVIFNFEEQLTNHHYFQLAHLNILCDDDLDYAILELQPVGQKYDLDTNKLTKVNVPPGLLKKFGPMPKNGEACLIGHPNGGVKKYDRTSIIEIGNRRKAVEDQLEPYKDTLFTLYSLCNLIKNQGIESILEGGSRAEKITTYNTFMHHGSSGSPVFDAQCKVFGLHTSGYGYNPETSKSVIECAQPLLTIFADFVSKLRENEEERLLKRVKEEAKGNSDLEKILKQILNPDSDEPMDIY